MRRASAAALSGLTGRDGKPLGRGKTVAQRHGEESDAGTTARTLLSGVLLNGYPTCSVLNRRWQVPPSLGSESRDAGPGEPGEELRNGHLWSAVERHLFPKGAHDQARIQVELIEKESSVWTTSTS
jgi:hypothetical protein